MKIKYFCAGAFYFYLTGSLRGRLTLRVNLLRDRTPYGGRYHTPLGGVIKKKKKLVNIKEGVGKGAHVHTYVHHQAHILFIFQLI